MSGAETGGVRGARAGSCRIYLLRLVHRAHLLLALSEQTDEQGLREVVCERRSVRVHGYDPADGEEVGPCLRISKQFRKENFRKFRYEILHNSGPMGPPGWSERQFTTGAGVYMLWCWIDMHGGGQKPRSRG